MTDLDCRTLLAMTGVLRHREAAGRGDPFPRFVIASKVWRSMVDAAQGMGCRAALAMTDLDCRTLLAMTGLDCRTLLAMTDLDCRTSLAMTGLDCRASLAMTGLDCPAALAMTQSAVVRVVSFHWQG